MHVGRAQERHGVLREETGLEIEITALLRVACNFLRPETHTLAAALAKPVGGAICPRDDVDELGWFSPGDKWSNFAFSADRHMVERYFATRLSGRARRSRLRPAGVNGTQLAFAERRGPRFERSSTNVLLPWPNSQDSACLGRWLGREGSNPAIIRCHTRIFPFRPARLIPSLIPKQKPSSE
jgi:hypothetical protein